MTDSNTKLVEFHLVSQKVIRLSMTEEEIMLTRPILADTGQILHLKNDGGVISIPVRSIEMMKVLPYGNKAKIPPPIAPNSVPAHTYVSEMDSSE